MRKIILSLLLTCLSTIAVAGNFISDPTYRRAMEATFNKRMGTIGRQFVNIPSTATAEETEMLHFLYAYMTLADFTDYSTDFYLSNVRATLQARREMPWGKDIPELIFRHFVVPLRVNNENLDSSRTVFYKELKDRVRNLPMKEAILEVNHWCHEHVTYHPSDARTLAPLACYRTALGRCGEESTFTVAALRAVGIPARQVYTPRWAHTDDNHAWVEAWADGRWWFIGACEPAPVLNLAWFNEPAARGLLMHTRVFGDYRGPEEVVLRTAGFTEINLVANYAKTARADFHILDEAGKPVEGARVEFRIYNYNEFYPAVTKYTDSKGQTSLTAGLGDMLVWASKDGKFGVRKVSFGKDNSVDITLRKGGNWAEYTAFDLTPPAGKANLPEVTAAQDAENKRRMAAEDSIRKAYEGTFYQGETESELGKMLKQSRGNWQVIRQFVDRHQGNERERALGILRSISEKDLRDMPMAILEDNFNARSSQLCPRVEDEMIITPFKCFLQDVFPKKQADAFRSDPALLAEWVRKNIRLTTEKELLNIPQTPVGVWRSRIANDRSRGIFFVDLARSLDIEARKDVVTGKIQYKKNGQWVDVASGEANQQAAPTGKLLINYTPTTHQPDPKYFYNFTICQLTPDGSSSTLNYEEAGDGSKADPSWENTFKKGVDIAEGTYLLIAGTRLASGKVLARTREFTISKGKTTDVTLSFPEAKEEPSVIGSFNSESRFLMDDKDVSVLSQTGRGFFIVGVVAPGEEPTSHALRDISKVKDGIDTWGRPMILLFESESDKNRYLKSDFGKMPGRTVIGVDKDGSIRKQIAKEMHMPNARQLPMFIVADTNNKVVFSSQGYTIGLGDQLLNVVNKLK